MILLANIDRLKKFIPAENGKSWWWYYFDAETNEMLYMIEYTDLMEYMDRFYNRNSDHMVGQWMTFDNMKFYQVVEVHTHQYENKRVTEIFVT
jgi:hypothetical protein